MKTFTTNAQRFAQGIIHELCAYFDSEDYESGSDGMYFVLPDTAKARLLEVTCGQCSIRVLMPPTVVGSIREASRTTSRYTRLTSSGRRVLNAPDSNEEEEAPEYQCLVEVGINEVGTRSGLGRFPISYGVTAPICSMEEGMMRALQDWGMPIWITTEEFNRLVEMEEHEGIETLKANGYGVRTVDGEPL